MNELTIFEHEAAKKNLPEGFAEEDFAEAESFHRSLPGYSVTPLVPLRCLAEKLGVKSIHIKDESKRFGLNAFKALGASFALEKALQMEPQIKEAVTATDGNHGRAVAWAAGARGLRATVFMPAGTADCRVRAISELGAQVFVTDKNYTGSVEMAAAYAGEHGAKLIQDTAFAGYEDIPRYITLGYSTLADEALKQMAAAGEGQPTHVFLQAGVGSMAGGVIACMARRLQRRDLPAFTVVEAENAACVFESVRQDRLVSIGGNTQTAMAGLNCGDVNIQTFPIIREYADFYAKCSDEVSFRAMRQLAFPEGSDGKVVAGECGAAGLGVLMEIMCSEKYAAMRKRMHLDGSSRVLLFSTEGNTDPEHYRQVVGESRAGD